MIYIGKCPYRISFLGGGSDLDWFVQKENYGLSLGFALNIHTRTIIDIRSDDANYGVLNYSSREQYQSVDLIAHPLIRETLKYFKIKKFVDLSSFGFSSGGGGLGGSSSFLLSLIAALNSSFKIGMNKKEIIDSACEIDISILNKPIGRQDHYLCGYGGVNAFKYKTRGIVENIELTPTQNKVLKECCSNLLLIPSNRSRTADKVLSKLKNAKGSKDSLIKIRDYCQQFLNNTSTDEEKIKNDFNNYVSASWEIKKEMSGVMDEELNAQYDLINLVPNNWIRLVGAGFGGYFLISPKVSTVEAIKKIESKGLYALRAEVSHKGLETIIF